MKKNTNTNTNTATETPTRQHQITKQIMAPAPSQRVLMNQGDCQTTKGANSKVEQSHQTEKQGGTITSNMRSKGRDEPKHTTQHRLVINSLFVDHLNSVT